MRTAKAMINSSLIHIDELFNWVDDFTKVTGISTYAALQVYAECCYFQDANALLQRLIGIEAEYTRRLENSETDEDGNPDIDGEIFCDHYGNHQLILDHLSDNDAEKFASHYMEVLIHHGFKKQFSKYFVEHFHPLSECVTSNAPVVDSRFLLDGDYSYKPFYTQPPRAPEYNWLGIFERLESEPAVYPDGWIAVFKALGFGGLDYNTGPSWPAYEPSFFVGSTDSSDEVDPFDFSDSTPVYVTPISITEQNTFSYDMCELRNILKNEGADEGCIVLYSAPYIVRAPDKKTFLSIWGEIFDGSTWKVMPLHTNSTSIQKILEDAFSYGSEPKWKDISSSDQPLIDIWQKQHKPSDRLYQGDNKSEVIVFKNEDANN